MILYSKHHQTPIKIAENPFAKGGEGKETLLIVAAGGSLSELHKNLLATQDDSPEWKEKSEAFKEISINYQKEFLILKRIKDVRYRELLKFAENQKNWFFNNFCGFVLNFIYIPKPMF